jgi:murein L,D-transpeptidase YcbB/YkuD
MPRNTVIFLIFLACIAMPASAQEKDVTEVIALEVETLTASGRLVVRGVELVSGELLVEVYERNRFELVWNRVEQIGELLEAIKATEADGLDPDDYHLAQVQLGYKQLLANEVTATSDRVDLDLLFTDSLIGLAYQQRFGKLNPSTLDPQWNFRRDVAEIDPAAAILDAIESPSLLAHLDASFARGLFYKRLRGGLAHYQQIEANGGWPEFPDGSTLRPGARDERVAVLVERLAASGDLSAEDIATDDSIYDEMIEVGVRRFQKRHGLEADGIIGKSTMRELNVSVEDRVRQLRVNLERARWVFDDISDEFILVNIAGFTAYVIRTGEVVWQTKVQVGKPFHKSPVFRDEMKYVVFNPTWTVPYSIATKEMLPNIQSDPDYFSKRDFDIKDRNGNFVDPKSIDWTKLSRANMPYTFVQRPSPNNALGRVKFMFPNEHAVYLHDTPSKHLFSQAERAFSHGCIRVENPFDFAEVLLGRDGWTRKGFDELLESGETKTVFLSEPLPVLLLYWTAEVHDDGLVYFYQDIYDRDKSVADGLDAGFALDRPAR